MEKELISALRDLLRADRDFLGGDNVCVYCDCAQHINGQSDDYVITKAEAVLVAVDQRDNPLRLVG